jgi:hypothetical protein
LKQIMKRIHSQTSPRDQMMTTIGKDITALSQS